MVTRHVMIDRAALIVLAVLVGWAIVTGRDARQQQNQGLRYVICRVVRVEEQSPKLTAAQRAGEITFWNSVLVKLHVPPCP